MFKNVILQSMEYFFIDFNRCPKSLASIKILLRNFQFLVDKSWHMYIWLMYPSQCFLQLHPETNDLTAVA